MFGNRFYVTRTALLRWFVFLFLSQTLNLLVSVRNYFNQYILTISNLQGPGEGSLERRILEINRKRVKVVKPGSKTSFPTTEIRGTFAPPFHVGFLVQVWIFYYICLDSHVKYQVAPVGHAFARPCIEGQRRKSRKSRS